MAAGGPSPSSCGPLPLRDSILGPFSYGRNRKRTCGRARLAGRSHEGARAERKAALQLLWPLAAAALQPFCLPLPKDAALITCKFQ